MTLDGTASAAPPLPKRPARLATTRDPEGTRAAILAASIREFTEKGFEGARIDAIAEQANINKRMLYHYFGGKDALYLAVLENAYLAIRTAEAGLDLAKRAPEEGLRDLVQFTFRYFVEHPEFLSLLGTENLMRARFLRRSEKIVTMNTPLIAELRGVLDRGAADGVFRTDADPLYVYLTMASMGFFYISNRWTLSTVFRRELDTPAEIASWGEHIAIVVLSYLKP